MSEDYTKVSHKVKVPNNPDPMSMTKEAPPGPYKKAADDYVEYYGRERRKKGTDIDGNVYVLPTSKRYRDNYDKIRWNDG